MPAVTDLGDGKKRVVSGKAFQKLKQETGSWCYAAVERMIKLAYGAQVGTQRDIATNYWTTVEQVNYGALNDYVTVITEEENEKDVAQRMNAQQIEAAARQKILDSAIENNEGSPIFDGTTSSYYDGSDESTLKGTFDGDNLAVQGTGDHYTLLYGYETDGDGKITNLLQYDPLEDSEGTIGADLLEDVVLFS